MDRKGPPIPINARYRRFIRLVPLSSKKFPEEFPPSSAFTPFRGHSSILNALWYFQRGRALQQLPLQKYRGAGIARGLGNYGRSADSGKIVTSLMKRAVNETFETRASRLAPTAFHNIQNQEI